MGKLFKLGTAGKAKRGKREASGDWHRNIRLAPYRFKRVRLCTDAGVSESWATMLQAAIDRMNAGEPPDPETMKRLPRRLLESLGLVSELAGKRRGKYADNVADYVAELETAGCSAMYVANVRRCLTNVGGACGWRQLVDVGRDSLAKHLSERKAEGLAPTTLNNIVRTLNGFGAWCVETQRLDVNPADHIKRVDETSGRKRERRALEGQECERLLRVAGPRELVYRVALGTGLRKREIRELQWRDLNIDNPTRPCVKLRAEATKAKRADTLPLSADLAARLREARPMGHTPTGRVFRSVPTWSTWGNDIKRADIKYRTDDGRIAGFHSLRVTYVTELQKAGLPPRIVQELARHTDYRLTATTYTDMQLIDTFGAVACLPTYDETEAQSAVRTGTDGAPTGQDQIQHQMCRVNTQKPSLSCSVAPSKQAGASRCDDAENPRSRAVMRGFGCENANAAERTRTSTPFRELDPKSSASANSATAAAKDACASLVYYRRDRDVGQARQS